MNKLIFLSILLLALTVRLYGLNWDQNTHLHPDERMIVMVAERLNYDFNCLKQDLSKLYRRSALRLYPPNCNLNPHFFAYGSLPIYLLKFSGSIVAALAKNPIHSSYAGLPQIGRLLNVFFDLLTLLFLYLIAKELISKYTNAKYANEYPNIQINKKPLGKVLSLANLPYDWFASIQPTNEPIGVKNKSSVMNLPLLTMFFYATAVFPIQNVKFYTVDTLLTTLTTLTIFLCLKFYQKPSLCRASLIAISLGLALATKISAVLLLPTIFLILLLSLYRRGILYRRFMKRLYLKSSISHLYLKSSISQYLNIFLFLKFSLIIFTFSFLIFNLTMPFALLDWSTFKAQLLEQTRMQADPFTFPFTLQYVNTTSYWYFVKNILLWGLGLPLGILAIVGTIYFFYQLIPKYLKIPKSKFLISNIKYPISIIASFFLVYFLVIGASAVKFMRYLLPLYPFLCLFAAYFFISIFKKISPILSALLVLSVLFWPFAFLSIYSKPHPRIQASQWMVKNIPDTAILAHENWDDTLPLIPHSFTRRIELSTYTFEPNHQWDKFAKDLSQTDYLIISSNRLYAPLMRLTNCNDPQIKRHNRCYPKTARFYRLLLNNQLQGFTKVAEFTSYPAFPPFPRSPRFPRFILRDDSADESFTVYDHPAVFIFQNTGFSSKAFFSQIP